MSLWSRFSNVLRGDRMRREIDEELQSHLAEAVEHGRDPEEAYRAFGPALRHREEIRDARVMTWLDSLGADVVFGWRQLKKRKVTSAASILSMALAIGACTSAFRLVDALLLRPLPVEGADRLYLVAREGMGPTGDWRVSESSEYPLFQRMRDAVRNEGELIAASYAGRVDLTYAGDEEMEKAQRQFVSGSMFRVFGLQPELGRLLTDRDDVTPGASAYAVLSYDYWTRRFARDRNIVGKRFRMGKDVFEIVGVVREGFTGTEPGTFIDVFLPTMMNPSVTRSDSSWFRALAVFKPDVNLHPVREKLHVLLRAFNEERAKGWTSQTKQFLDRFLDQRLILEHASSGVSGIQRSYRLSLLVLGVLVALVLLIASANVANLLTAQAAARAREMALRVSIGAGRTRLVQMVLVESAMLGFAAAAFGGMFAWWAAPFVVSRIGSPGNESRLFLPADWRVLGFGLAIAVGVTFLFAIAPALRVSSIRPASALKGGDDPHARRRLMHVLIAAQVAFCFVVHLAAGLFAATSDRLVNQSTGFDSERLLTLDTIAQNGQGPAAWNEVEARLRAVPGVESVSLSGWPLLSGNGWNGFVWVNGTPTEVLAYFLGVSPGWTKTMGIPMLDGRDLRPDEVYPGAAIVNETFVRLFFGGGNAIGRWFEKESGNGVTRDRLQVVGVVADARYRNMREPISPTAYVPFSAKNAKGEMRLQPTGTFVVRTTTANPNGMASTLRREVPLARPEFRVSNIRTQTELNQQHTVRERLLAMLALFFASVAILLAGVGLYGVLDYNVLQRRREFGIRIAIGAPVVDIARRVTVESFLVVLTGALCGLGLGIASLRYVETLLYGVKANEWSMLVLPCVTIAVAAVLASLPAVIRAIRVDPVTMLRTE